MANFDSSIYQLHFLSPPHLMGWADLAFTYKRQLFSPLSSKTCLDIDVDFNPLSYSACIAFLKFETISEPLKVEVIAPSYDLKI